MSQCPSTPKTAAALMWSLLLGAQGLYHFHHELSALGALGALLALMTVLTIRQRRLERAWIAEMERKKQNERAQPTTRTLS